MSKKKIPKGWIDYLPYGDFVEGTKLFPFKTPLKLEMQCNIPKVQRFTPACLMANRPNLRAVIDLTDTEAGADRYYCQKDFIDGKVEHLKLRITGGGLVPGPDKIKLFSDAVDGFLKKYSDDPDALIGVHCTHGLNRTGYFICMYMVTRMGCSPIEAIESFQKARGYVMYRMNFLEEIKQPGIHTSGQQVADYGDKNKQIRSVGNYQYQNTWLEERPNKRPFRGFTESEIRNGGRRNRRQREDRSRGRWQKNNRERHRREENQTSGFSRGVELGKESPILGRDCVPNFGSLSSTHSGPCEPVQGFPYDREQFPFFRPDFPVQADHILPGGEWGGQVDQERIQFRPTSGFVGGDPPERDLPQCREPFTNSRSEGIEQRYPPRENLWGQQAPLDRTQLRGQMPSREHREWTRRGFNRRGAEPAEDSPNQERNRDKRNSMEYRSPLDEDGFEVVSYCRYRNHRGGRSGRTS